MNRLIRAAVASLAFSACPAHAQFVVNKLWTYNHATATAGRSAEIVEFDALNSRLWVVGGNGIDVLDLAGARVKTLDTSSFGTVNSIAIRNDVAAVSFSNPTTVTDPGTVKFFSTTSFLLPGTPVPLGSIAVGAVPDMVTWTPDGRLLVANEGERPSLASGLPNPPGSVSIITYDPVNPAASTKTDAGFGTFDANALIAAGVRLQPGVTASAGLEPEYIAVSKTGDRALVTLQEANAFGVLNLLTSSFEKVVSLGLKDFSAAGSFIDPSDADGTKTLRGVPVKGLYMPDSVVSYLGKDGKTYYVTSNEGDAFVDDWDTVQVRNAALALPGLTSDQITALKADANLGKLLVSRLEAYDPAAQTFGPLARLLAIGGRSFAVWDEDGKLVKDSGDAIERELLARPELAQYYADNRSDDKGVEPEGIVVKKIGDRIYAFVGLERTTRTVIAVFDITDPTDLRFIQFIVADSSGQLRPEGLSLFEQNGLIYLAVAQEDPSNITTLYQLAEVPEPSTYALMIAGLLALGWAARRRGGRASAA